ncbi:MAG TPA: tRNA (adenosine(37)-N6)-threonylcarbamoyltransferase complex ATPase subunit type 1 TsaE [Alphaproteobacteria bacterium]|nr:tRNA (adenosine(37)-N6)-threonylcarbamoyltransferase complex ATPase subunit type 1 TsaE [Alphaproteobacteria bacterium]
MPFVPQTRIFDVTDLDATVALAARLAQRLRRGDIIALHGTLGVGKTSFARALIQTLLAEAGIVDEVPSPTFSLVQQYFLRPFTIWHFDFYRIDDPAEAYELGIEEAFAEGVSLIEWPERIAPLLPEACLEIHISTDAPMSGRRRFEFRIPEIWEARLADI